MMMMMMMMMMRIKVPKVFRPLYKQQARYKGLRGGRGSGKSWAVADYLIFRLYQDPNANLVCLREVQKSIKHSSKRLIESRLRHYGLESEFEILQTEIKRKNGNGIIIFQGLQDHTADSIKSLEGFDFAWVEEAQTITEWSLDLLVPTIRKPGAELLFSWNPRYRSDAVEKLFRTKTDAVLIKANYTDNPFCPQAIIDEAEELKEKDPDKYAHIYLGGFVSDTDNAIIPRRWILAAIDAHKKLGFEPVGEKRIGYDVADGGDDANAYVYAHGGVAIDSDVWQADKDEIVESAERVARAAARHGVGLVSYDSIGVGASVGSIFNRLGVPFRYEGFNAGAKVYEPWRIYKDGKRNGDHFANLKAQAWQNVADRFMATYNAVKKGADYEIDSIISIDSNFKNLDQLIEELSAPGEEFDNLGRFRVERKDSLEKRGIPSPNLADAFIMAFNPYRSGSVRTSSFTVKGI